MGISSAVDPSAKARTVGIKTDFKNLNGNKALLLPQRVALIGQGTSLASYSTTKLQATSAAEVGSRYGTGSPLHLAALQLFPANGDGIGTIPLTVYPLEDDGSGVAAAGDITPAGTATTAASYAVVVNNIQSEAFVIDDTDSVATMVAKMVTAINAVLEMPVIASNGTTTVDLVAKWKGTSSNDITVRVDGPTSFGVTFGFTQPVGGLINPDVQPALDQFGNVWETMVMVCFEATDTTILDAVGTFGEGRWGATVRKPFIAFYGIAPADVATAIAVPDARKDDRINSQLPSPASEDLPVTIGASELVRVVVLANTNPAHDYGGRKATGLTAGPDGDQWDYPQRDQAVKAGSSTIEVIDGVVTISDVVTFYHPTGETPPAYSYVVDIVKLQQLIYNLDIIFTAPEWNGAPLIPDDQATDNPAAKNPRMAKAVVNSMIDSLALKAILSDPDTAKANTITEIDDQNPKRLNVLLVVQLSGNTNIISVDLNFGFFFGS